MTTTSDSAESTALLAASFSPVSRSRWKLPRQLSHKNHSAKTSSVLRDDISLADDSAAASSNDNDDNESTAALTTVTTDGSSDAERAAAFLHGTGISIETQVPSVTSHQGSVTSDVLENNEDVDIDETNYVHSYVNEEDDTEDGGEQSHRSYNFDLSPRFSPKGSNKSIRSIDTGCAAVCLPREAIDDPTFLDGAEEAEHVGDDVGDDCTSILSWSIGHESDFKDDGSAIVSPNTCGSSHGICGGDFFYFYKGNGEGPLRLSTLGNPQSFEEGISSGHRMTEHDYEPRDDTDFSFAANHAINSSAGIHGCGDGSPLTTFQRRRISCKSQDDIVDIGADAAFLVGPLGDDDEDSRKDSFGEKLTSNHNQHSDSPREEEDDDKSVHAYLPAHLQTPPRANLSYSVAIVPESVGPDFLIDDSAAATAADSKLVFDHFKPPELHAYCASVSESLESKSFAACAETDFSCSTKAFEDNFTGQVTALENLDCGIGKGDCILSITERSGKTVRQTTRQHKRFSMTKSKTKDSSSVVVENLNSAQQAVQYAIRTLRSLRKAADLRSRSHCRDELLSPRTENSVLRTPHCPSLNELKGSGSQLLEDALSVPVDSEEIRDVNRSFCVLDTEIHAISHLEQDAFDDSFMRFEQIYLYLQNKCAKTDHHNDAAPQLSTTNVKILLCIATTLHNIGIVHLLSERYSDAVTAFQKAADIRQSCLGNSHIDYVSSNAKMGVAYYALENFARAQMAFEAASVLRPQPSTLKWYRPQMAETSNNLACVQFETGQLAAALKSYTESLEIQEELLNESLYSDQDDSNKCIITKLSITRCNIGCVLLEMKKPEAAITFFEAAFLHQQLILSDDSPLMISTIDQLALANLKNGNKEKALKLYGRILKVQIQRYGANHAECAQTLAKINLLHVDTKRFDRTTVSSRKVNEHDEKNDDSRQGARFQKLLAVGKLASRRMSRAVEKQKSSNV